MAREEVRLPQPDDVSSREKEDAKGAYFMMFAAWGIGLPLPVLNLVAAVIYFIINRKTSRFIAFHSLQSLLSQIPVTLINLTLIAWLISILITDLLFPVAFYIYLIFMILMNILYIVISIIALLKAEKGRFYYMPLFGRFSFEHYYGSKAAPLEKPTPPNKPPGVI